MKKYIDIFRIRRDERWLALGMLLAMAALNALVIWHYYGLFTPLRKYYWTFFIRNFHISGFDPITYSVVSDWSAGYNVFRHPLLAFYMFIPYLLNQALMSLTGVNCALFIVAAIEVACSLYAAVFFYRILHEVVEVSRLDATLLTLFLFSFAYVMLSGMVPDHFMISMMLLLIALYISGRRIKNHHQFKVWQSVVYFLLTAGTSLNNGLKIFLSGLFVNGRRFFRPRYLLLAVVVPAAVLWGFSRWEYRVFVWPTETARHAANAKRKAAKEKKTKLLALQQARQDSIDKALGIPVKPHAAPKKKPVVHKQGTPISNGEFMRWTDITTSRWQSGVENLFGESIQLHQDYLLDDAIHRRPVIVHYRHAYNYVVEAIIVMLFLVGIWCGRRSKFFGLCLSWFALDMVLHMGLGFAINEVYIMSAHWIYIIPIAVAFLMRSVKGKGLVAVRSLVALLTVWLWTYNVWLITGYLV